MEKSTFGVSAVDQPRIVKVSYVDSDELFAQRWVEQVIAKEIATRLNSLGATFETISEFLMRIDTDGVGSDGPSEGKMR